MPRRPSRRAPARARKRKTQRHHEHLMWEPNLILEGKEWNALTGASQSFPNPWQKASEHRQSSFLFSGEDFGIVSGWEDVRVFNNKRREEADDQHDGEGATNRSFSIRCQDGKPTYPSAQGWPSKGRRRRSR
jgi:hypothetical protein